MIRTRRPAVREAGRTSCTREKWTVRENTVRTLHDCEYHTPLVRFSKLDCSTTKRVPRPHDTWSESSRRDVSHDKLFGTGTIFQLWTYRPLKNRAGGGSDICVHRPIRYNAQDITPPGIGVHSPFPRECQVGNSPLFVMFVYGINKTHCFARVWFLVLFF